jgi:hypothetical protein
VAPPLRALLPRPTGHLVRHRAPAVAVLFLGQRRTGRNVSANAAGEKTRDVRATMVKNRAQRSRTHPRHKDERTHPRSLCAHGCGSGQREDAGPIDQDPDPPTHSTGI